MSEWEEEVAAWRKSGQTSEEYAEGRGILASTLLWWSWRVKKRDDAVKAPLFLPLRESMEVHSPGAEPRLQVEIVLSGGRSVRLLGDCTLAQLGRVLEVVERGRGC